MLSRLKNRKFLLFCSLILFLSFVYFSYLVAKETFVQFDFDTTVRVQNHVSRHFDLPFSLLSFLGTAEITGLVWLFLLVFALFKRYWLTFLGLFLMPIALFLEVYGKVEVFHPAPPYLFYRGVLNYNFPSQFIHTDYSYPSGHLTRTAFIVFFLATYLYLKASYNIRVIGLPILFITLLAMAVSRIYLGEHWTSDVIGGILIGSSFGILSALTLPQDARVEKKSELTI